MYEFLGTALIISGVIAFALDLFVWEPARARRAVAHRRSLVAAEIRARNVHPAGKGRTDVIPFPVPMEESTRRYDRIGYDWTEN